MKLFHILIFLVIFVFVLGKTHFLKNREVKKSILYATADDFLTSIKINGDDIIIPPKDKEEWQRTKKFELGLLPGDILSLSGKNWNNSKYTEINPVGLIATLHYVSPKGKTKIINTDDVNWKCDGEKPVNLKKNGDKTKRWGIIWKNIDLEAVVIWGKAKDVTTTCTYTIPCDS